MERDIGYCLYLPPGYVAGGDRRYPVIYNLHGAGGHEGYTLHSAEVLHEGILSGRWPEMIMVFPNGGRATRYRDSADGRFLAETTIVHELIPHIDATYRTVTGREGRCLEGFSMGGGGSVHLGMRHPRLFCSLFAQSGTIDRFNDLSAVEEPWGADYLGPDLDRRRANDPYANLDRNLADIRDGLRILLACGADDPRLASMRSFHAALLAAGVAHDYFEEPGLGHQRRRLIDRRRTTWFDFHVESLRRAGAKLHWRTASRQ